MAKKAEALHQELINLLQGEKMVLLTTTDAETKKHQLSAVSWLVADQSGKQIKFAVGHKASSAENIEQDPYVALGVIGAESCYAIQGRATVSDIIEKTIKLKVVTVDVHSVEDVMFYGGKLTVEPEFEKTYSADMAKKIDDEVYALLQDEK